LDIARAGGRTQKNLKNTIKIKNNQKERISTTQWEENEKNDKFLPHSRTHIYG
jgi:hypothetical protein